MTNELSARAQLREWVRGRVGETESVTIPDLVDKTLRHFRKDEAFLVQFAAETLRPAIYDEVQREVGKNRELIPLSDSGTSISREEIDRRAERFASRFLGWYEHTGDKHVRLLEMTREDLVLAASERRGRGDHELHLASLWEQLAGKLEGGQKVAERFTVEEIETLYTSISTATEGAA